MHLVLVQDKNINVYILGFKSAKNMEPNKAESHSGITLVPGVAQEGDPYNFHSLLSYGSLQKSTFKVLLRERDAMVKDSITE